jgi:hypothetical protein
MSKRSILLLTLPSASVLVLLSATTVIAQTPTVTSVDPTPAAVGSQVLRFTGTELQANLSVSLTDPAGKAIPAPIVSSKPPTEISVRADLATAGTWKATFTNPGGNPSAPFDVIVAAPQVPGAGSSPPASAPVSAPPVPAAVSARSPNVFAFAATSIVTFLLFCVLLYRTVKELGADADWKLRETVSEKWGIQPGVVANKQQMIMVGSASRLIGLVGLLAIVTIVLAIGYGVVWSLFVYATVPDLSHVQSFLLAAATLFVPYVANQMARLVSALRQHQEPSGGTATQRADAAAVTGTAPAPLTVSASQQTISLTGAAFQRGLSVTLTDPKGTQTVITGASVTYSSSSLASVRAIVNRPGQWTAAVANPAATTSSAYRFEVLGPPTITGHSPTSPTHGAPPQAITLNGEDFMAGLTLELTGPTGVKTLINAADIVSLESTKVRVNVILDTAGDWHVVATNPGPHRSNSYTMAVS